MHFFGLLELWNFKIDVNSSSFSRATVNFVDPFQNFLSLRKKCFLLFWNRFCSWNGVGNSRVLLRQMSVEDGKSRVGKQLEKMFIQPWKQLDTACLFIQTRCLKRVTMHKYVSLNLFGNLRVASWKCWMKSLLGYVRSDVCHRIVATGFGPEMTEAKDTAGGDAQLPPPVPFLTVFCLLVMKTETYLFCKNEIGANVFFPGNKEVAKTSGRKCVPVFVRRGQKLVCKQLPKLTLTPPWCQNTTQSFPSPYSDEISCNSDDLFAPFQLFISWWWWRFRNCLTQGAFTNYVIITIFFYTPPPYCEIVINKGVF